MPDWYYIKATIRRFPQILLAVVLGAGCSLIPKQVEAEQWRLVREGILFGISGMALWQQQNNSVSFVIVHDNKNSDEGRLAVLTLTPQQTPIYMPLSWPNAEEMPADLEAITAVPGGGEPSFMAATSYGKIYHLTIHEKQEVSLLGVFDLPPYPEGSNFEGFALQEINGKLLAFWGHRGQNEEPGVIYWGTIDLNRYQIAVLGEATVRVPFPVRSQLSSDGGGVRCVSDLKVDPAGIVYISAAIDSGNDGPFASAWYAVGAVMVANDRVELRQNTSLVPLRRFPDRKIEAFELFPGASGGVVFGSDDENMGGWVYAD
ncbi:hypothetical protein [[Phormidium] sp. ETS-05]|uniref:hypothetical protein n=1 Tax=[Phormidium] sp. ETS-05 TaxID=222819 RepID=UPI001E47B049|nr:hypothetical protein [[Phormidium] sp. ETS-05]